MGLVVTVLIAGITDSRWPATQLGILPGTRADVAAARVLSPFDQAAIECALKLRDADKGTQLRFVVVCDGGDSGPMREAAAFRPDRLVGVPLARELLWDAQASSEQLAAAVLADVDQRPGLVLVGREFGDFDEGSFAPCLAEAMTYSFVPLVQEVRSAAQGLVLLREQDSTVQCLQVGHGRVLARVTNAKVNRLRHPLMKNVMAARRQPLEMHAPALAAHAVHRQAVGLNARLPRPRTEAPCRMLEGPPADQARQFTLALRQLLQHE